MTNITCCGRTARRFDIQTRASALSLVVCPVCENRTWLADGVPTARPQAFDAISTIGNRPRVAV